MSDSLKCSVSFREAGACTCPLPAFSSTAVLFVLVVRRPSSPLAEPGLAVNLAHEYSYHTRMLKGAAVQRLHGPYLAIGSLSVEIVCSCPSNASRNN